jgi:hypothetical protein
MFRDMVLSAWQHPKKGGVMIKREAEAPPGGGKISASTGTDGIGGNIEAHTGGLRVSSGDYVQLQVEGTGTQSDAGVLRFDAAGHVVLSVNNADGFEGKVSLGPAITVRPTYTTTQLEATVATQTAGVKLAASLAAGQRVSIRDADPVPMLQGSLDAKFDTAIPLKVGLDVYRLGDAWSGALSGSAGLKGHALGLAVDDLGTLAVKLNASETKTGKSAMSAKVTWSKTF